MEVSAWFSDFRTLAGSEMQSPPVYHAKTAIFKGGRAGERGDREEISGKLDGKSCGAGWASAVQNHLRSSPVTQLPAL